MRYRLKLRLRRVLVILGAFGFHPVVTAKALCGVPRFVRTLLQYRRMQTPNAFKLSIIDLIPIFSDFAAQAGTASGHYFHQDLWAARHIYKRRPNFHHDIGSRIDGFISHLLVFMDVTLIDLLPLDSAVPGLHFVQGNATHLHTFKDNSLMSLSSLHAAEHFGLGRYSDPIDPAAHENFMKELQRILAPGGRLYFSVPIGRERLNFNAHRVFSVTSVIDIFSHLKLLRFSYVDDDGNLHDMQTPYLFDRRLEYGCGLFEFSKD